VKPCLAVLFGSLLVLAAAPLPASAAGNDAPAGRQAPRIVFGENAEATYEFGDLRPLRRSDASSREAYFGSGDLYTSALADLQAQMQELQTRYRLEALPLTPAQEAAKAAMPPALMRALTLAKQALEDTAAADEP